MTIQISGTTVIDQSRNLTNIQAYFGPGIATQAEAQAGTNNDQLMTPLRVKQAVSSSSPSSLINRVQRGYTELSYNNTAGANSGTNVPISSVNTGKSFVSQTCNSIKFTINPGIRNIPPYYSSTSGSARLTSATNINVSNGRNSNESAAYKREYGFVSWEVIEFQ